MIIFYEHMNAAWTLFAPLEQKTEEVENFVPIWAIKFRSLLLVASKAASSFDTPIWRCIWD